MCTLDRIKQLLKDQGKTQKDLTDFLNLRKSTFTSWNAGLNSSYKKYIDKIAEFLGVSTDYLLGKTDTKKVAPIMDSATVLDLLKRQNKMDDNAAFVQILGSDGKNSVFKIKPEDVDKLQKIVEAFQDQEN